VLTIVRRIRIRSFRFGRSSQNSLELHMPARANEVGVKARAGRPCSRTESDQPPDVIRKTTLLAAPVTGLTDRGLLRPEGRQYHNFRSGEMQ
jgi:hypothetical protein